MRQRGLDVTGTSQQRFDAIVEEFAERGVFLAYEGIRLSNSDGELGIVSFADWSQPESNTPEMAQESFQRAKLVLEDLCSKSATIKEIAARLPHTHYFCIDLDWNGLDLLAKETDGAFEWCWRPPEAYSGSAATSRGDFRALLKRIARWAGGLVGRRVAE